MTDEIATQSAGNFVGQKKIAFIGAGNMARAIIAGLTQAGWPASQIMASNPGPDRLHLLSEQFGLQTTQDNQRAANFGDVLVLAVKPQKLTDVCQGLTAVDFTGKLIISVAAGFPTDKIAAALNCEAAIIRVMPNTPALIGLGASGLYANPLASKDDRNMAESIFNAVGKSCWIDDEAQMDIVTAIAGSSPAYVFLLMQAMLEQAVDSGLPQNVAFTLITQAVAGAAMLAQHTPQKSLTTLRQEVTSKGGTTEAALNSFIADNFEPIVKKAVRASIQRGKELGNQS